MSIGDSSEDIIEKDSLIYLVRDADKSSESSGGLEMARVGLEEVAIKTFLRQFSATGLRKEYIVSDLLIYFVGNMDSCIIQMKKSFTSEIGEDIIENKGKYFEAASFGNVKNKVHAVSYRITRLTDELWGCGSMPET